MTDAQRDRSGAVGGVVFVALVGSAGALGGQPPAADAPASEIAEYLAGHEGALRASVWLLGLGAMALVWWAGSFWRRMVRAEGEARLAVVSLLGLAITAPLALSSSVAIAATSAHVEDGGENVRLWYEVSAMLLGAEGFSLAAHLIAANILGVRTGLLSMWLVALGLVSALSFVVAAVLGASGVDMNSSVGLLAFVLWCAWILGVSYSIWTGEDGHRHQANLSTP